MRRAVGALVASFVLACSSSEPALHDAGTDPRADAGQACSAADGNVCGCCPNECAPGAGYPYSCRFRTCGDVCDGTCDVANCQRGCAFVLVGGTGGVCMTQGEIDCEMAGGTCAPSCQPELGPVPNGGPDPTLPCNDPDLGMVCCRPATDASADGPDAGGRDAGEGSD